MNSNRQLGITTGVQAKSSEKLSSGYKINRAADDAAGLVISEKMRRQIRGLTQASDNVQDGVSYVQVADAALAEIDEMLARMNELCIQAANDTLTPEDRQAIDAEIQALKVESNRTFHTTSFNDKLIWDENTTDRKVVGTEDRPIFTWTAGDSWYPGTLTPTNMGAWPGDGKFGFEATDSGVKVKWKGYDGKEYTSNEIKWPEDEEDLKTGFNISLNSTTMDYSTYPAAVGINPNLRLSLDSDATKSQLISELNSKKIYTSVSYGFSGTVAGDNRTSISGNITYNSAIVSRASAVGEEDHIDPASANNRNSTDDSTMEFAFKFNKNANTEPKTPSTFDVLGKYSGSVYTYSGDRRPETEGIWWNEYHGTKYGTSISFSNDNLKTALENALNGTDGKNSLINNSSTGGSLCINFNLSTSDSVKYKADGETVTGDIGSFVMTMGVDKDETTSDVLARINNITGADITKSYSGGIEFYNGQSNTFKANIYGGTMQLNIQAGSESDDDNVIPVIYDVLNNHSLGINDLNSLTRETAVAGIDKIKSAARVVDEQRSIFGAYQNRMEHAVKNLDNVVENTQHSESVIRDTDMAAEMVKYSNNNILAQAGQSMLAQANQTNQGVLSLLQ